MCGIVGICSVNPVENREWLCSGRDAMYHRGPDGAGEWWSKDFRVGMGHRRLSILDLSNSGHQPMHDKSGCISLVFNGEVYNFIELRAELQNRGHRFRSTSDTEVLLASYLEWGASFVEKISGMFAYCIFDANLDKVFMGRDRAGEKPLFYFHDGKQIRYASELKALFAAPEFPRDLDRESLDCFLLLGFVPGEKCIINGVKKLPAAHTLVFDCKSGELETRRYWSPPPPPVNAAAPDELLDTFESLLQDSVRRQLISDVPVGVLLSGGIDSSLVTAMAVRESPNVKTFTVGNPNHKKYDETAHARLVAQHFGTDHTELQITDISPDLLDDLASQFDEPLNDSSMIPTFLVSKLIRKYCKVAIGGDGGDELFGGYHSHDRMAYLQYVLRYYPRPLRRVVSRLAKVLPDGTKGKKFLKTVGIDLTRHVPFYSAQFEIENRRSLLSSFKNWNFVAESIRNTRVPKIPDPVQRVTRLDFENYMVEDILVKVDRASMLNSLEVRSPFLDHRLAEFAFGSVPSNLKATHEKRKILPKMLAKRILPSELELNRKQGFGIPLPSWLMGGEWRDKIEDVLMDDSTIFCRKTVTRLLNGVSTGKPYSQMLFGIALFELWRNKYNIKV